MPIGSRGARIVALLRPQDQMKAQIMGCISEWILEEGLTQAEAARRLAIPKSVIVGIVGGRCGYSFGRLLDAWVRCGGTWALTLKHQRNSTARIVSEFHSEPPF